MRRVLVELGTPAAPTAAAVRAFLAEFLGDPRVVEKPRFVWLPILHGLVLRRRPEAVAELYRSVWTDEGSPLLVGLRRLAAAVGATAALRYGEPSLRDALTTDERVVVTSLYPQRTASSTGTTEVRTLELAREFDALDRVTVAGLAPNDPGYVEAVAARARGALQSIDAEHLLVTHHGIPVAVDEREGQVYSGDSRQTFDALLARLDWPRERATLAYQSRFGREPWLTPATDETLAELARRGVRRVAVVAPGFLIDGLETLEELDIRGRETFLAAGGTDFARAPAAGAHPALVEALQRLGR